MWRTYQVEVNVIDLLVCNSTIVLQQVVVLRAGGLDKLLQHGLHFAKSAPASVAGVRE